MSRQGVAILIIIILIIVVGGIALAFLRNPTSYEPAPGMSGGPSPVTGVCTMDAKMCPDGSYVGRVPPSCEFAACPVSTTTPLTPGTSSGSPIRIEARLNTPSTAGTITFTPTAVIEDSRCPINVQCIQAGTVRVQASTIGSTGLNNIIFTLNGTPTIIDNMSIWLVEVTPTKSAGTTVNPADYRFIFSAAPASNNGTPTGR